MKFTVRDRCENCKRYLSTWAYGHSRCCPYCGLKADGTFLRVIHECGHWKRNGWKFWQQVWVSNEAKAIQDAAQRTMDNFEKTMTRNLERLISDEDEL